jgi:Cupin domain
VPVAHSHDAYEESLYGLEGVLTWTIDGEKRDIGPGEALCIPRGVVHMFENEGPADARVLAIVSPGLLGPDYFREIAAVVEAAARRPTRSGGHRSRDVAARPHACTVTTREAYL